MINYCWARRGKNERNRITRDDDTPQKKVAETTEHRLGERSKPGRTGGGSAAKLATPDKPCQPVLVVNLEVSEKPLRRRFTAEYKLRFLQQVDALWYWITTRFPGNPGVRADVVTIGAGLGFIRKGVNLDSWLTPLNFSTILVEMGGFEPPASSMRG